MSNGIGNRQRSAFSSYWRAYGGASKILESWYFWGAVFFTLASWRRWTNAGWWDDPISVLPGILGFTLAGFAIFLGTGNDGFRKRTVRAISPADDVEVRNKLVDSSALMAFSATFLHFVLIQTIALLVAVFAKNVAHPVPDEVFSKGAYWAFVIVFGLLKWVLWLTGYLLYSYSLFLVIATGWAVLRLTRMIVRAIAIDKGIEQATFRHAKALSPQTPRTPSESASPDGPSQQ